VSSSVSDPEKDLLCTTVASVPDGDGVSAVRDTSSLGDEVPDGVGVGVRVFSLLNVSKVGESVSVKVAVFDSVDERDLLACSLDPVRMVRVVLESVLVPMELESLSVMESVADRAAGDRVPERLMYTDGEMVPVLAGPDRVFDVVCSWDGVCDDEYVYDSGAVRDMLGVSGLLDSEKLMVCDCVIVMVLVSLSAPVKECVGLRPERVDVPVLLVVPVTVFVALGDLYETVGSSVPEADADPGVFVLVGFDRLLLVVTVAEPEPGVLEKSFVMDHVWVFG
jgi:hypothetical protein